MKVLSRVVTVPSNLLRWKRFHEALTGTGCMPEEVYHCVPLDDPYIAEAVKSTNIKRKREISLFLYTIRSIQDALKTDCDAILLYEDDARPVSDNPSFILHSILQDIPEDFGVCYLGGYFKKKCKATLIKKGEYLAELKHRPDDRIDIWGTHAMLYGRSAFKTILKHGAVPKPSTFVTDSFMTKHVVPFVRTFAAVPTLFVQSPDSLNINKATGALHGAFKFDKLEAESAEWISNALKGVSTYQESSSITPEATRALRCARTFRQRPPA